jgi:uncharacterized protein YbjT (DUF2867 family)
VRRNALGCRQVRADRSPPGCDCAASVRTASRSSSTPFDWSDPAGWDAALDGVTAVYVVPPAVPGPVHGFVARAEAAGVQRLVLLSGQGADDWGDSTFGRDMRSDYVVRTAVTGAWDR